MTDPLQTSIPDQQEQMVPMIAPDGTTASVPQSQIQNAVSRGAKMAVQMTAPDGTTALVPHESVPQALQAGAKLPGADTSPWQHFKDVMAQTPNVKGVGAGLIRAGENVAGAIPAIHKNMTAPPQNDEEKATLDSVKRLSQLGGPFTGLKEMPEWFVLGVKRMLLDPSVQDWEKYQQLDALKKKSTDPKEKDFLDSLARVNRTGALVPVLGPMAANLLSTYFGDPTNPNPARQTPDKSGALAEGLGYVAAPETIKKTSGVASDLAKAGASAAVSKAGDLAMDATKNAASYVARKAGQMAPTATSIAGKVANKAGRVAAGLGVDFASGVVDTLSDTVQEKLSSLKQGASANDVFAAMRDLKSQAVDTLSKAGVTADKAKQAAANLVSTVQDNYEGWNLHSDVPKPEGAPNIADSIKQSIQPIVDDLFPQNKGGPTDVARAAKYYPEIADFATKAQMHGGGLQSLSDFVRTYGSKKALEKYDVPAREMSHDIVGKMLAQMDSSDLSADEASQYIQQELADTHSAIMNTLRDHESVGVPLEDEQLSALSQHLTQMTETELYKRLMKADPDIVGQRLIESSPDDFKQVIEGMGKENADIARRVMVSKMTNMAMDERTGKIDFEKLGSQVQANKVKLGEQYPRIKTTVDGLAQIQEDVTKIRQKSMGWAIGGAALTGLFDVLTGADPVSAIGKVALVEAAPFAIARGLTDYVMAPGGMEELSGLLKTVQTRVPSTANIAAVQKKASSILNKISKQAAKYATDKIELPSNTIRGGMSADFPGFGDVNILQQLPKDRPLDIRDVPIMAKYLGIPEPLMEWAVQHGSYKTIGDLLTTKGADLVNSGKPSAQVNRQLETLVQVLGLKPDAHVIMHEGAHAALGTQAGLKGEVNTLDHVMGERPDAEPVQGSYQFRLPWDKMVGMVVNKSLMSQELGPTVAAGRVMDLMRGMKPEEAFAHSLGDMNIIKNFLERDFPDLPITDDHVEKIFEGMRPHIEEQLKEPGMQERLQKFSDLYKQRYPRKITDAELKKIFTTLVAGVLLKQTLGKAAQGPSTTASQGT